MSRHPAHVAAWEDFVLRLIAIYKLIKAVISIALGIGLLRLVHHKVSDFLMTWVIDPFHFDPESRFWAALLEQCSIITPHSLRLLSYAAFFYAAIFATEGIGLYLRKHWAEYMVLISTGSLLPIEFYEISLKLAWWKAAVVVGNLAILIYLIHRLWLDSQTEDDASDEPAPSSGRCRTSPDRSVSKVP
jgi:uncharacterized membrane protein (DUF2068 family)